MKSPEWIVNKRAIINTKSKGDNKCFEYSIIVALHHQDIENYPQNDQIFISLVICIVEFPAGIKDWKRFE